MKFKKQFNFDDYPELEKLYKQFKKLGDKLSKLSNSNKNTNEVYQELSDLETGKLSKMVFDTFHKKVGTIITKNGEEKTWAEIFGDDWELLDSNHKRSLTWLLDGNFVYRLPDEFYKDSPYPLFD